MKNIERLLSIAILYTSFCFASELRLKNSHFEEIIRELQNNQTLQSLKIQALETNQNTHYNDIRRLVDLNKKIEQQIGAHEQEIAFLKDAVPLWFENPGENSQKETKPSVLESKFQQLEQEFDNKFKDLEQSIAIKTLEQKPCSTELIQKMETEIEGRILEMLENKVNNIKSISKELLEHKIKIQELVQNQTYINTVTDELKQVVTQQNCRLNTCAENCLPIERLEQVLFERGLTTFMRDPNNEGVFHWKITDFFAKTSALKSCGTLYSPYFYTRPNEYRMGIEITYCGNYLKVFFRIVNGEFDDELSWPFYDQVTVTLVDQEKNPQEGNNLEFTSRDTTFATDFVSKPDENSKNYMLGSYNFLEKEGLMANNYIERDTLYFIIKVWK